MNFKSSLTRTVIVFAALAAAGLIVAASAQFVAGGYQQTFMLVLGSALFGASVTFFLLRLFFIVEK